MTTTKTTTPNPYLVDLGREIADTLTITYLGSEDGIEWYVDSQDGVFLVQISELALAYLGRDRGELERVRSLDYQSFCDLSDGELIYYDEDRGPIRPDGVPDDIWAEFAN